MWKKLKARWKQWFTPISDPSQEAPASPDPCSTYTTALDAALPPGERETYWYRVEVKAKPKAKKKASKKAPVKKKKVQKRKAK